MRSVQRIARLVLATALGLAACGDEPQDTSSTTGAESTSGPPTTTTTTATTESGPGAESSSGPAPGDGILQCVETCTVPSECCLPGTPCPGPYPYNVDCKDGLCVRPHCEADEDCAAIHEGGVCTPVHGVPSCVLPCESDDACTGLGAHYLCRGTTDEGATICLEHCDQEGVFCGNATCDPTSGLCVCESDGQCQSKWVCLD